MNPSVSVLLPSQHHHRHAPLGGKLLTPLNIFLGLLGMAALVITFVRLFHGLGAVTNINDGYPWGSWIVVDVMIGTAFACGGYAMAIMVYVFNDWQSHPMVRPALLASALGYSMGGFAIFLDTGRWWNSWAVFWPEYVQMNSVMWEVAVCITLYIGVMWIELSVVLLEKKGWANGLKTMRKVMFALLALAVVLPSMHQAGLGTVLVAFGNKIHPLWQTNLLPLLFLLSALALGYSVVIFESHMSCIGFRLPSETPLLARVSRVIVWLMVIFLALRFTDLAIRHHLATAFDGSTQSWLFLLETVFFAAPIVLLSDPKHCHRAHRQFLAACALLSAGALYRLNAFFFGYMAFAGWKYYPSVVELIFTIGLIALEVLLFILLVRTMPVMPHHTPAPRKH